MIYIRRSTDGQFYFVVNASNGQTLVTSETYKRKASCKRGIASLARTFGGSAGIKGIGANIIDETKKAAK